MKLLISWEFPTQQCLEFTRDGAKNKNHRVSDKSVGGNALLIRAQRKMSRLFRDARKDIVSTLYNSSDQKSIYAHSIEP